MQWLQNLPSDLALDSLACENCKVSLKVLKQLIIFCPKLYSFEVEMYMSICLIFCHEESASWVWDARLSQLYAITVNSNCCSSRVNPITSVGFHSQRVIVSICFNQSYPEDNMV